MLCADEDHTPHACKFAIFSDGSCVRIIGDKRECSVEFFTKKVGSLCSVASPPMRLVAYLLSSGSRGFDAKCH